jgi:glucose/arabinose dehydrogenase
MKKFVFLLIGFAVLATNAAITAEKLTDGVGSKVWSMEELPDGNILFTTWDGGFHILDLSSKAVVKLKAGLKIYNRGQGGLLDVKLHPDYNKNKKIYFTYSCEKAPSKNTTCLGTALLDQKKAQLTDIREIFAAEPAYDSANHFGSRLAWDNDGHLFMTMGDRYSARDEAQNPKSHLGKILRLDQNGKAEIWSLGHRNPQGLFFEKSTGILWEHEHGARGGDEINKIEKGKNYGWPVITHGVDYTGEKIGIGKEKAGMEQPLHTYTPSIAPSGLIVYSGKKFPSLKGNFLLGSLVGRHLNVVSFEGGKVKETRMFETLHLRVRDVLETSEGDILFSTDSEKIYRFKQE